MINVIIRNPETTSYLGHLSLTLDQCNLLEFLLDNDLLTKSVEFEVINTDEFQQV